MLFSQVEDYLPSGWSIQKIEEMLKSETAQALLPLLKDPSDFGVDDLKTVMKDENIHKMILDQVKKMLPADIDLELRREDREVRYCAINLAAVEES